MRRARFYNPARVGPDPALLQLEQESSLLLESGDGLELEQSSDANVVLPLGAKGASPRRDTILVDR